MRVFAVAAALSLWALYALSQTRGTFDDSLFVAVHYIEYSSDTDERFAAQTAELRRRVGSAPHVLVGFSAPLAIAYPATDIDQPLSESQLSGTLLEIDKIVERARTNNVPAHISIMSGFFHNMNALRKEAIRQDVRNAQWFADGWIADPAVVDKSAEVPSTAWVTPSRYAKPLRARMEEGARIVGSRLAARMMETPGSLLTLSGDGEVELSYERSNPQGEAYLAQPQYADYSPFMIQEFRDWIVNQKYQGDRSPSSDDNRDGRTFNRDFKTAFTTWQLRYFDSSGPIPYSAYRSMPQKLPAGGPNYIEGGFDAPRAPRRDDSYWELWVQFRTQAISNFVRDFASWITTSPAPGSDFTIPPSRFYSHQIPADHLFGLKQNQRLDSSASPVETAFISPAGSAGITVFNTFDGKRFSKTGTAELFNRMSRASSHWGIFEYNLSMPGGPFPTAPSTDMNYYLTELRTLYEYRPHVIVPFAWTDIELQPSTYRLRGAHGLLPTS